MNSNPFRDDNLQTLYKFPSHIVTARKSEGVADP